MLSSAASGAEPHGPDRSDLTGTAPRPRQSGLPDSGLMPGSGAQGLDEAAAGPARRETASQKALRDLQQLCRGLAPGTALPPQRALAHDLRISRATLREAVSILHSLGIVRIEHGRGTFVAGEGDASAAGAPSDAWRFASRYTVGEVFEFRIMFEPMAASLAATNITRDGLAALEANLIAFERAIGERDLVAASQSDYEFHDLVIRQSGNRLIGEMGDNFRAVILDSQRLPLQQRERICEPLHEHRLIAEAIGAGDGELAAAAMRIHLRRAAARAGTVAGATGPARQG